MSFVCLFLSVRLEIWNDSCHCQVLEVSNLFMGNREARLGYDLNQLKSIIPQIKAESAQKTT